MSPAPIHEATIAGLNCGVGIASGEPLLLLHGVIRRWQTYLPLWPMLSQRWQMFVPDQRGHGKSPRALTYLVTDYVDDAVAMLEAIGKPTVVYGHSLGAMVAFGVAARRPDLVRAVVAEDPPFSTMGEGIEETQFLSYFKSLQPLAGHPDTPVEEITARLGNLVIPHGPDTRMLRDIRDAVALRFTSSALQRVDPAVLHPIVAGHWLDGYQWPRLLGQVRCPALVFQADLDMGGMLRGKDIELLRAALPHLLLVPIKGCGHVMHWSHATSIAQHTSIFLEAL